MLEFGWSVGRPAPSEVILTITPHVFVGAYNIKKSGRKVLSSSDQQNFILPSKAFERIGSRETREASLLVSSLDFESFEDYEATRFKVKAVLSIFFICLFRFIMWTKLMKSLFARVQSEARNIRANTLLWLNVVWSFVNIHLTQVLVLLDRKKSVAGQVKLKLNALLSLSDIINYKIPILLYLFWLFIFICEFNKVMIVQIYVEKITWKDG